MKEKIHITGYSLRAPESNNVKEFYENLKDGRDMTTDETRYPSHFMGLPPRMGKLPEINKFDNEFFQYSLKSAERMDPSIRLLLEITHEALLDARVNISGLRASKTGVYMGHCFSDYLNKIKENDDVTGHELIHSCKSMAAGKISYFYDFKGPSVCYDTACSSSLVALENAFKDLQNGTITRAVVGGISLTLDPAVNNLFNKFKMLSPDGKCFVFDDRANGYCRSEGIGVIILESSAVCSHGYATLEGIGVNSDGYIKEGITYPNKQAQIDIAEDVLCRFNIDRARIGYVEAHGTGTKAGDKNELTSIASVHKYRNADSLPVGSVKSNIGHCEGASGLMAIVKLLMMYEKQQIFPSINFENTSHQELLDGKLRVVTQNESLPEDSLVTVSNYGFTGTNAFAVLGPGNVDFTERPELALKDTKFAFVYNGQGSQNLNMGKQLYKESSIFRETIDRLSGYLSKDLSEWYTSGDKWMDKKYSSLGIISFQIALTNMMREVGVSPTHVFGHSLGEISCAYAKGLLTEQQAICATNVRVLLVEKFRKEAYLHVTQEEIHDLELCVKNGNDYIYYVSKEYETKVQMNGKMLFVGGEADIINKCIQELNLNHTCIACYNNPKGHTVSGPADEIDSLFEDIPEGIMKKIIDTDGIPYHSPILQYFEEFLREEFEKAVGTLPDQSLEALGWISTSKNDTFNIDYLVQNILRPVYFYDAVENVSYGSHFLEVGPKKYLASNIGRTTKDSIVYGLMGDVITESSYTELFDNLCKKCQEYSKKYQMPLEKRYNVEWNHSKTHKLLIQDNKNRANNCEKKISFDLRGEYAFLKNHQMNNEPIFPASGYIYLIWKHYYFANIQLNNFEIHQKVSLENKDRIVFTLGEKEIKFEDEIVVSFEVSTDVTPFGSKVSIGNNDTKISTDVIYPFLERSGVTYKNEFCSIDGWDFKNKCCSLKTDLHPICYLDAILQQYILFYLTIVPPLPTKFKSIRLTNYKNLNQLNHTINTKWIGNNDITFIDYEFKKYYKEKPSLVNSITKYFELGSNCESKEELEQFYTILGINMENCQLFPSKDETWDEKMQSLVLNQKTNNSYTLLIDGDGYNDEFYDDYDFILSSKPHQRSLILSDDETYYLYVGKKYESVCIRTDELLDIKKGEHYLLRNSTREDGIFGAVRTLIKEGYSIRAFYSENDVLENEFMFSSLPFIYQKTDGTSYITYESIIENQNSYNENFQREKFNLVLKNKGNINSLTWVENDAPCQVYFAALNFRDVMKVYGKLDEDVSSLGMEFSGVDKEGKYVMGLGEKTLGSYCTPYFTYPVPDNMTMDKGATILVAYLTAYYCLFEKGRLNEGDSVLIHAGAGGVGMACIQLCLSRGIRVYTTCSTGKREFLKERFGLEERQIGNSRDINFKEWLLEETDGCGVDLVINSLAGPFQVASIECVGDCGNFCEIGKFDISHHSLLDQHLLERNISFHAIDLLPMFKNGSKYGKLWKKYLDDGFANNEIVPLPTHTYHMDSVKDAFRYMGQGKHIGKVLIKIEPPNKEMEIEPRFFTKGTHIISGGLGGLGLELSNFLSARGAEKLYLISRSGIRNPQQKWRLSTVNTKVEIVNSIEEIDEKEHIEKIWHLANDSQDALLENITETQWNATMATKYGLYKLLRNSYPSRPIICFGSVAALHGNIGQCSYSYANDLLKKCAENDENTYLLELGPLYDVGMAKKMQRVMGDYEFISSLDVISQFDNLDFWKQRIMALYANKKNNDFLDEDKKDFLLTLDAMKIKLAELLGGSSDDYEIDIPVYKYGLDSLSLVEYIGWLKRTSQKEIKVSFIEDKTTLRNIFDYIYSNSSNEVQNEVQGGNDVQNENGNESIELEIASLCSDLDTEDELDDDEEELEINRFTLYNLWKKKDEFIRHFINI